MKGPNPRRWIALLAVSDSDPSDRPWNAPRNAITPWRFVKYLDSLIAASVVSVPEFAKNVRTSPSIGAMDASSCARRTCGSEEKVGPHMWMDFFRRFGAAGT